MSARGDEGEQTGRADVVARAAITVQGLGSPDVNVAVADMCKRALTMLDADSAPDLRATVEAQLACALIELDAIDEAEHGLAGRSRMPRRAGTPTPNSTPSEPESRSLAPGCGRGGYALGERAIQLAEPAPAGHSRACGRISGGR